MQIAKHKFALAGTSCAGKTTLAHQLIGRLKTYGILADGVTNADRRFSFPRELIETQEIAQNWMINNLIAKEIDLGLHGDTFVMVNDRSVLDFYAYYAYQYPNSELCIALWTYVQEWLRTYDKIYILEPLPYQDDGKRPGDEFRMAVNEVLDNLARTIPNVAYIDRKDVLNDILQTMGIPKPTAKNVVTVEDLQAFCNAVKLPLVAKMPTYDDGLSDVDCWVIEPLNGDWGLLDNVETYRGYAQNLFGKHALLDVHVARTLETFDPHFLRLTPQLDSAQ